MSLGFTHESSHNESKEWYTPPEIFEALGLTFDLDPASPPDGPVPWVPARQHYSVYDNGLLKPWDGLVWLNPPYGQDTPRWMRRLAAHGEGIALVFARTDTAWFHETASQADVLCFIRGRIRFIRPDGSRGGTPGTGSLLIAFGQRAARALVHSRLGLLMRAVESPKNS